MRKNTQYEIEQILQKYDADNDIGPDAPVTWREKRLAEGILELLQLLYKMEQAIIDLENAVNK